MPFHVYRVRCSPQLLAARLEVSERAADRRRTCWRQVLPSFCRILVDRYTVPAEALGLGSDIFDAALYVYHNAAALTPDRVDMYLSPIDIRRGLHVDWPTLEPYIWLSFAPPMVQGLKFDTVKPRVVPSRLSPTIKAPQP